MTDEHPNLSLFKRLDLRNLANAADLVGNNPALMQLRVLHALSEATGNTIALGWPPGVVAGTGKPAEGA